MRNWPGTAFLRMIGAKAGHAIDAPSLLERCLGDAAIAELLLRKFEEQLRGGDIEALEAAVSTGDRPSTARVAHALKGAAGAVGAKALQGAAAALERAANEGTLRPPTPQLRRLRKEVAACLRFLPAARRAIRA